MKRLLIMMIVALNLMTSSPLAAQEKSTSMHIKNSPLRQSDGQLVLFPFDDVSLPFQHGVQLELCQPKKRQIVLAPGPVGSPDHRHTAYYGTVIKVGNEYWMWYLGQADTEVFHQRVCFARSADGYRWEKPNLGLVEFNGRRDNNLVDLDGGSPHVVACVVFHDPDDKDPGRRFKMALQREDTPRYLNVAFSADGLRWQLSSRNAQEQQIVVEHSGIAKIDGCYYLLGHGGAVRKFSRTVAVFASYNFEDWTTATCVAFRRDGFPPRANELVGPLNAGPFGPEPSWQTHLGAGLWNRGNVIIGFYGMWNQPISGDRRQVTMPLGLLVSNDGLHYREPVPDYPIISPVEDGYKWGLPYAPDSMFTALQQGQGAENIGDETLVWYSPWPQDKANGIRAAVWPRDRLGYFHSFLPNGQSAHVISAPIALEGRPARVFLNVDGLSEHSRVNVEVLDERFAPLPGYTRKDAVGPQQSGLHSPAAWRCGDLIPAEAGVIRLRVNIDGLRPEDVRLYALYVEQGK